MQQRPQGNPFCDYQPCVSAVFFRTLDVVPAAKAASLAASQELLHMTTHRQWQQWTPLLWLHHQHHRQHQRQRNSSPVTLRRHSANLEPLLPSLLGLVRPAHMRQHSSSLLLLLLLPACHLKPCLSG
jgi:hypothetical protein